MTYCNTNENNIVFHINANKNLYIYSFRNFIYSEISRRKKNKTKSVYFIYQFILLSALRLFRSNIGGKYRDCVCVCFFIKILLFG